MLEGQILTWGGDRVDMANSMEARPAFLHHHHLAEFATSIPPEVRIKGRIEKHILREAMKGLLPQVLYKREKFAFMAPPAHTDRAKFSVVKDLAGTFASRSIVEEAGLLDYDGIQNVLNLIESTDTPDSDRVQLDAVVNHILGVQVPHASLIAADIPALARRTADELGWTVGMATQSA